MRFDLHRSRASGHTLFCLFALLVPFSARAQIVDTTTARVIPRVDTAGSKKTSLAVQSVRLVSPYQLERERLEELAGAPAVSPMLLRSVSAYITRVEDSTRQYGIFFPELQLVNNNSLPWSMNDGDLWAGRGLSTRLAGGVFRRNDRFQLVLAPELTHEANKYFALHIPEIERVAIPPDRSQWAFPWYVNGPYSVDMPTRFGDRPFGRLSLGQSSLLVNFSRLQFGFANENEWWGPGINNALVLSNNAPGFPHLMLRSARPIDTRIGRLDFRWIVGGLNESSFFDTTASNNLRSITAGAMVLQMNRPAGLSLGVTRSVWETADRWGQIPIRWLELFHAVGWPNRVPLSDSSLAPGGRDQIFSLFARWVMPESGFEIYGEWGRTEFPPSIRNFVIAPNHTQAYTLGFQWRRPGFTGTDFWRVQAENTSVEQSPTFRDRPLGVWYTSRKVIQGYTNRGQPLGAAIGPGSSGQNLNIDYMRPTWSFGMKAGRIRYNEDVRSISPILEFKSWCTHDIDLYWGPRLTSRSKFGFAAAEFAFGNRIQPWFQVRSGCPRGDAMVDIRNNTVNITWSPFDRR
ncbi:MAG TPA: capsule assembly Wzi family protein [Gemmatimonadaceae bacterium]|nr:capsule assembly Wzi family protein [Gemmatimonadaceae bacterium]